MLNYQRALRLRSHAALDVLRLQAAPPPFFNTLELIRVYNDTSTTPRRSRKDYVVVQKRRVDSWKVWRSSGSEFRSGISRPIRSAHQYLFTCSSFLPQQLHQFHRNAQEIHQNGYQNDILH